MKNRYILLLLLISIAHLAWWGPTTSTGSIASKDILVNSADTHSVGTSTTYLKNGYLAYLRMSEHTSQGCNTVSSFGCIYVSTDNNVYFVNDSGTKYKFDVTAV